MNQVESLAMRNERNEKKMKFFDFLCRHFLFFFFARQFFDQKKKRTVPIEFLGKKN